MNFNVVKSAVAAQFERIQKTCSLFRVAVDRDELWATYLASFPAGANPILRQRTEHDCSCCRQFIRAVGDVVGVTGNGEVVSVWDIEVPDEPAYTTVLATMAALVRSCPIAEPFLHPERTAGTDRNFEQITGMEGAESTVKTWTHFFVNIDRRYVMAKAAILTRLSEARSTHDVYLRSLREITRDAIDTVLDLIAQGSLYRGDEHRAAVAQFRELKAAFEGLADDRARDVFAWTGVGAGGAAAGAVGRMRNTAIGTLLVDLSEGRDLEVAVKSFESKVAPTNYKRPTALVTRAMIEKAKERIEELGLTSALERRFATLRDMKASDVVFADRDATRRMVTGDVFDDLAVETSARVAPRHLDRIDEVPIDRFLTEIVPRVSSIEVLFENRHAGNLVSLIAPVDPTAGRLFKWGNPFSWSYSGELADAIKERVKRAGGNVTGDLCCRLAWWNRDDLDLYLIEPHGNEIYYASRVSRSTGGMLDVDMNVMGETREPVENIFYQDRRRMLEGEYRLFVHQFNRRESIDVGFECEIDYLGTTYRFAYTQGVRSRERVEVARFRYTHAAGFELIESLPPMQATRTLWGIPTQTFHRVSLLTLSPNHWYGEAGIGNKHYFFMLDGCRNDGTARSFFNEFLSESLTPHRKVFEMVGAKMKPADTVDQLSGLGFSSTRRDSVVCRVKGSFTRTIRVNF